MRANVCPHITHLNNRYLRVSFSSLFFIFCLLLLSTPTLAQTTDTLLSENDLKKLSLEELMNVEVTSVSMRAEKLTEVASAVQVISAEDIHRSGVTRLPEALRLASNLQVSQANSHDWAITSRGFNGLPSAGGILANKLLVMVDGRSIYSSFFGGVYWDVQNVMLPDIDHIEVVSGPGGALWDANAVNGVINITRKSAKETQGLYVSGAGGSFLQDHGEARYGFRLDSTLFCRIYGQRYDQKNTRKAGTIDAQDAWNMTQAGFRVDYYPSEVNTLTLMGDFYGGAENRLAKLTNTNGQNVLFHFTHLFSEKSDLNIKAYYDRTYRISPNAVKPTSYEMNTYDIHIHHHFMLGKRQNIVWGGGYRLQQDKIASGFNPLSRDMPMISGFLQDEIECLPDRLKLTIGSKFLNNIFSGFEVQPSARLAFLPHSRHTIWTSVSRAIRTPSRFDYDVTVTPVKFDSEKVIAYELGYRMRPVDQLLLSFSTFYNQYAQLRSLDSSSYPGFPIILANSQAANSWGVEFASNYQVTEWWRLRTGYSYFEKDIYTTSSKVIPGSEFFEGVDPKQQVMFQSIMDLPWNLELDLTGRYVDPLPAVSKTIPAIPAYVTFDVRLAWNFEPFEISLVGQNLREDQHAETGSSLISRSIYGRITCQF